MTERSSERVNLVQYNTWKMANLFRVKMQQQKSSSKITIKTNIYQSGEWRDRRIWPKNQSPDRRISTLLFTLGFFLEHFYTKHEEKKNTGLLHQEFLPYPSTIGKLISVSQFDRNKNKAKQLKGLHFLRFLLLLPLSQSLLFIYLFYF